MSFNLRRVAPAALVSFVIVACGGQVIGGDGGAITDASADAVQCIDIKPSDYDTTCKADADCMSIASGSICTGYECLCPGATISADAASQYQAALAMVTSGKGMGCGCPLTGIPHCIAAQCVFCPVNISAPIPPGCPDAG